jgi:gamma-glutamyltranspeptidase/glutathione hydrolase
MARLAPFASRYAPSGLVCAVDHLAAAAGVAVLRAGGNAADAAVATSAVLAVTTPHLCGMGGDLFALVHPGGEPPAALNASGRAGSGADPERLRAEGHRTMPAIGDIRAVSVPGCVDGWLALHERFGRLPLAEVLAGARRYAEEGFPAAPDLVAAAGTVRRIPGAGDLRTATHPGALVRRPGTARALHAIVKDGRDGFYRGEFGTGLLELGGGEYLPADLDVATGDWVIPLSVEAWESRLWTMPPNSQGYLTLAGAWIASGLPLPADPDDPRWAHLTIEAARFAAYDRVEVLHEGADGPALLAPERLAPRRDAISADRTAHLGGRYGAGDTIHLAVVDRDRMAVSLIQSNASGFGALIVEPATGTFLHNRGLGFSLEPEHPAEYGPRRRPPHTLSPALVTGPDGALKMVMGTMGGDSQPQILLQLAARLLGAGESAGDAIAAGRWVLSDRQSRGGFATWADRGQVQVELEALAPSGWFRGLEVRGHQVERRQPMAPGFGHAHVIVNHGDHLEGASDPRATAGAAVGY